MLFESQDIRLLISAADKSQFPDFSGCEIVMVGKSNVGKSSLINALCNRKRLAYVGKTPGKTRLINFYQIRSDLMLVDVPGYGFANRSKEEQAHYARIMEDYFALRKLSLMLVLLDSRRGVSEDDELMMDFAAYHKIPYVLVLTKTDKLPFSKLAQLKRKISNQYDAELFTFTSLKPESKEDLLAYLQEIYETEH